MKPKKQPIKPRSRECEFCKAKVEPSWNDVGRIKEYLSARSKILTSKFTGVCVKHQKRLAVAVKRARHLALLPFTTQE